MTVNFVILTTQRSGSTWVVDVLDKCADTSVFGELFLPDKMKWQAGSSSFPQFFEARKGIRPFTTFTYLNQLYRQSGNIGFKLMYSNLRNFPEIIPFLCWRRIPVVHLVRYNVLDMVISSEMAQANGQWHLKENESAPAVRQIWLDPQTLVQRLQRLQAKVTSNRRWLQLCRLPHLEIGYEALLADASEFNRIFQFLGLSQTSQEGMTSFSKIRHARYADEISNYSEIKEVLTRSEFAPLLASK